MIKKIIAILLALTTVALLFSSCSKIIGKEEEDVVYSDTGKPQVVSIFLPYSSGDSINPFFANGIENVALSYIYCQPLFTVKSNYESEAVVADSYTLGDKSITVGVNPMIFSDGTTLTASDVVYSFKLAKKSPAFSQRLRNVKEAVASSSSVIFTLGSNDKLVTNVLTFPIVKTGTADSEKSRPIGSGVFMFSSSQTLKINKYGQTISAINTVKLQDIKTLELAANELEIGNINYFFEDFSEGSFRAIVAENKSITLNNLVYLGINCNNEVLSSSAIRTAIYYAINKENASATPYQGYAVPAVLPFNPDFIELENAQLPEIKGDKEKCNSIIEKLGYNYKAKSGAKSNNEYELNFTLIVNKNNAFRVAAAYKIAEELESCGFKIQVVALDSEKYKERINEGTYQLCLGEVKLPENMDLYAFSNGFYKKSLGEEKMQFFKDYQKYKADKIDMNALISSYLDDVPFVPICYRVGIAAYTKTYTPDFTYAPFDIYGNIENWETVS